MDKIEIISRQSIARQAVLYGRGLFRLFPVYAFMLPSQLFSAAAFEWALKRLPHGPIHWWVVDAIFAGFALFSFLTYAIFDNQFTLNPAKTNQPVPSRRHYFAGPMLAYAALAAAICFTGFDSIVPNGLTPDPAAVGRAATDSSLWVDLYVNTSNLFMFMLLPLLAMTVSPFILFHALRWPTWKAMGHALAFLSKLPLSTMRSMGSKVVEGAIGSPEELALLEQAELRAAMGKKGKSKGSKAL